MSEHTSDQPDDQAAALPPSPVSAAARRVARAVRVEELRLARSIAAPATRVSRVRYAPVEPGLPEV